MPQIHQEEELVKKHQQNQAKGMFSQQDFVKKVDVQSETVYKYIRENKIIPDLIVAIGEKRNFNYFKETTIKKYAEQFGWGLITNTNIKEKFIEFIEKMDMNHSYKPVLLKAIFANIDKQRKSHIIDIIAYFIDFYEDRREEGLVVEKPTSIYHKSDYKAKEVEYNIINKPLKRFEDMGFLKYDKAKSTIELNEVIFKDLNEKEKKWIVRVCDRKIDEYYEKVKG